MTIISELDGLPAIVDINAVKKLIQRFKIKFWVQDLEPSKTWNKCKCKVKFFTKGDYVKAKTKLILTHSILGVDCDLKMKIISEDVDGTKVIKQKNRDRSRSPISKEEATINKELEQLKKEKEELEKRQSELLRKKMTVEKKEPINKITSTQKFVRNPKLHYTVLPKCPAVEQTIMEDIKPLTKPYATKRFYQALLLRLHTEVKTKLAILMENNKMTKTMPVPKLVKLYRDKYPKECDEELVETVVLQLKMSFWPYRSKNKDIPNKELYAYDESDEEDAIDEQDTTQVENDGKMEDGENDTATTAAEANETEGGNACEGDDAMEYNEAEDDEMEYNSEAVDGNEKKLENVEKADDWAEDSTTAEADTEIEDGTIAESGNEVDDGNKAKDSNEAIEEGSNNANDGNATK